MFSGLSPVSGVNTADTWVEFQVSTGGTTADG